MVVHDDCTNTKVQVVDHQKGFVLLKQHYAKNKMAFICFVLFLQMNSPHVPIFDSFVSMSNHTHYFTLYQETIG